MIQGTVRELMAQAQGEMKANLTEKGTIMRSIKISWTIHERSISTRHCTKTIQHNNRSLITFIACDH